MAGELSLDGVVRHTPGIISMISTAAANGMCRAFVPAVDATEAALVGDVEIIPVPKKMPASVVPIASTTAIAPAGIASIAARVEIGDAHDAGVRGPRARERSGA